MHNRDICFNEIDHFLFVRISDMCEALGCDCKGLVENGFFVLAEVLNKKGFSHFEVLEKAYSIDKESLEIARPTSIINRERHSLVAKDVHEEIHSYLEGIKNYYCFPWSTVLKILLMLLELDLDKRRKAQGEGGLTVEDIESMMKLYCST